MASVPKRHMAAHNGRYPKARVTLASKHTVSRPAPPATPPPLFAAHATVLSPGRLTHGSVRGHWQVARELEKTESALAALENRVDSLREKNAMLDERNKLLVRACCCHQPSKAAKWQIAAQRAPTADSYATGGASDAAHALYSAARHMRAHSCIQSLAVQLFGSSREVSFEDTSGSVIIVALAAQDKYLELAPEPLHIDEWWVDPRTRAALETSVGLGDHVTFTADQTRPFQLTRSQVRVRGLAQTWPRMAPMPHTIRTRRRRCDTVVAWTRLALSSRVKSVGYYG